MIQPAAPPLPPDMTLRPATVRDAAELCVLQRCCWVSEAIANDTLAIPALHETVDDVRAWVRDKQVWVVRHDARLVAAVRAHQQGQVWEIGRLMVAPDLSGQGVGRRLLSHAERQAPADVRTIVLFTGERSARNLRMYTEAGYRRSPTPPGSLGSHIQAAVFLSKDVPAASTSSP